MPNSNIPPWPSFTEEEVAAVAKVLRSNRVNYWTGDEGRQFESEFAEWCDTSHAIALANGTVALDLALIAGGIGPGDEVIVTPRSFMASVSCVVNAGAKPVFADVDLDSQNITAESIAAVLTDKTRAIICVHLAGWPCDMDPIMALAGQHGLFVIEDCAQAHGAKYRGRPVGGIGHVGAWSFCQDKIMTTGGEGGMVTTNDEGLWNTMWSYKDHGKSYAAVHRRDHPPGFRWLHESFGTNWRMTEMQSAIGRLQLSWMDEWHARRSENARQLRDAMENCSWIRTPHVPDHLTHAYYKYYAFANRRHLPGNISRDDLVARLGESGVPCYQGACPEIYLEKAFDNTGFRPAERLANARTLGEDSLMFLVHPTLSDDVIGKWSAAISAVLK